MIDAPPAPHPLASLGDGRLHLLLRLPGCCDAQQRQEEAQHRATGHSSSTFRNRPSEACGRCA